MAESIMKHWRTYFHFSDFFKKCFLFTLSFLVFVSPTGLYAASTVGTNISTDGTLDVTGHSTFTTTEMTGLKLTTGASDTFILQSDPDGDAVWVSVPSILGSASLGDLSDVSIGGGAAGDLLYFDGADWLNLTDGTSGQVLTSDGIGGLSWTNVSGSITDGTVVNSILRWDGAGWVEEADILATAAGALTVSSTLTANGDVDLGDADTDTVTFTAKVDSDVLPSANDAFTLGAPDQVWENLYVGDGINFGTSVTGAFLEYDPISNHLILDTLTSGGSLHLKGQGDLHFGDSDDSNKASIQAPAVIPADYTLTLPVDDGTPNQILETDGNGILTWITPAGVQNLFETMNAPLGTDPVADSPTDTLNLASTDFTITGDATTDTLTFNVADDALNFTELSDALSLDENTHILLNEFDYHFDMNGTGDFAFEENDVSFFSIENDGKIFYRDDSGFHLTPYAAAAGSTSEIRFEELVANGSNYIGFKAPDSIAGNVIWTWPSTDGASGEFMTTDGTGTLGWSAPDAIETIGDVVGPGDSFTEDSEGNNIWFEGTTADANEILLTAEDPGADFTVTLPAATGTVALTNQIIADGTTEHSILRWDGVNWVELTNIEVTDTGAVTVNGVFTAIDEINLGNTSADTVTFAARIGSDIIPQTNNTYDLGSSTNRWQDLYLVGGTLHIGSVGDEGTMDFDTVNDHFTFDSSAGAGNVLLRDRGDVRFGDGDSSNWVAFQSAATVTSNVTWTLPDADGTNGQFLSTDGAGTLSWESAGGAGDITAVGDISSGAAFTATAGSDGNSLFFEGSTGDANEVQLTAADPGADVTVTIPATTGTLALLSDLDNFGDLTADETITGNWDNTANPWADNEVADDITISSSGSVSAGALTLSTADGTGGTSSGSGLEIDGDALGMLQGCADGEILKWVDGTATWDCDSDLTGGTINSFETIDAPAGTDPVADSATDTLAYTVGTGITITGDSATDTLAFALASNLVDIAGVTSNQGDILYYNGTNWVDLPPGTSGEFLQTQGAGADPQWASPAGSGDITAVGDITTGAAFTETAGSDGNSLWFEGATGDANEVELTAADAGADVTITLPALTGTVGLVDANQTASGIWTITGDWVNTTNPWADNEVADNITISSSGSVSAGALTLSTADGTGGTSSGSGLEIDGDALGMLQGCADGEILKWDDGGATWDCATDNAGGGGANSFETMNAPAGTDPVADSATDTLNWANGSGIAITGDATTDTLTVALGPLTADWNQTGAFDIILNNADSQLQILESTGGTFFGTLDAGDLTADRTITIPDASGTIALTSDLANFGDLTQAETITGDWDNTANPWADNEVADDITISSGGSVSAGALTLSSGDGAGGTSSGSGLEIDGDALGMLQGCSDGQVLAWNEAGSTWGCTTPSTGSGDITAVGDITSGAAFTATAGNDGNSLFFEGSTSNSFEVQLTAADPAGDVTVTLPATTGTLALTDQLIVDGTTTHSILRWDGSAWVELTNIVVTDTGAVTINDQFTTIDDTDIGNTSADTVTFAARVDSDFIPLTNNTYDLGATANRWQDLYLTGGTLHIGSNGDEGTIGFDTTNDHLTIDSDAGAGNVLLRDRGDVRFGDTDSSNWVAFQGAGTISSNVTWTLPAADGTDGQVLSTDGAGVLTWETAGGSVNSFETMNAPLGTDPVADSATDTLNWASTDLTITGDSGTDTLTLDVADDALNFSEFADSLTLDASTTISLGANQLTYQLEGTGDIVFQDNGTTFLTLNDSGGVVFADADGITLNPYGSSAGNTSETRYAELAANGTNYVGFKSPDVIAGNVIWTLPNADGTTGQVLQTNGTGGLTWVSVGGSQNLFETIDAPAGTDPVADSATDTLTFTTSGTGITITGSSTTDTLDFTLAQTLQDVAGLTPTDGFVIVGNGSNFITESGQDFRDSIGATGQIHYDEQLAEQANATTTYTDALTTSFTPTVTGNYLIQWSYEITNSSSAKNSVSRVHYCTGGTTCDGGTATNIGNDIQQAFGPSVFMQKAGFARVSLTSGQEYTIDIEHATEVTAGGATSQMRNIRLFVMSAP